MERGKGGFRKRAGEVAQRQYASAGRVQKDAPVIQLLPLLSLCRGRIEVNNTHRKGEKKECLVSERKRKKQRKQTTCPSAADFLPDLWAMHTLAQLRAGQLAGATRLDLSAGLTEFPREIFDLADSLEVLNLSGNALAALPDDLPRLRKLRVLFCSDNQFTAVPEVLGQCPHLSMIGFKANQIRTLPAAALPPQLRWLILTDNQLAELPPEIGDCPQLEKLMLAGNQLTALPD
nr:hypothetical protein [Tanacetum cinerariifolium]